MTSPSPFGALRGVLQLASGLGEVTLAKATEAAESLVALGTSIVSASPLPTPSLPGSLPSVSSVPSVAEAGALAQEIFEAARANRESLQALVRHEVERAVTNALGAQPDLVRTGVAVLAAQANRGRRSTPAAPVVVPPAPEPSARTATSPEPAPATTTASTSAKKSASTAPATTPAKKSASTAPATTPAKKSATKATASKTASSTTSTTKAAPAKKATKKATPATKATKATKKAAPAKKATKKATSAKKATPGAAPTTSAGQ